MKRKRFISVAALEIERDAVRLKVGVSAVIPHFYLRLHFLRGCVSSRLSGYLYAEGKMGGDTTIVEREGKGPQNLYHEFPRVLRVFRFFSLRDGFRCYQVHAYCIEMASGSGDNPSRHTSLFPFLGQSDAFLILQ
jgi:hypothetical protein